MMSAGGAVVSVVRVGVALRDAADIGERARLRRSDGGPSTAAYVALAREVAGRVHDAFGVDLVPEPVFVGHAWTG